MNFEGFDLHKFERHLNTYIHDIINLLKENGTMTFEDIKKTIKIDLYNNHNLLKSLKTNQRIIFHENTLTYKHTYAIKTKQDLKETLVKTANKEGIELSKLKDCPVDNTRFLEELTKDGLIIILKDNDGSEIVFYNEMVLDKVDEDVQGLWRGIEIPTYQDLISQLNTAGIKKDKVEHTKRKVIVRKEKTKRYKRRIKITNTHVQGLDLSGMDGK